MKYGSIMIHRQEGLKRVLKILLKGVCCLLVMIFPHLSQSAPLCTKTFRVPIPEMGVDLAGDSYYIFRDTRHFFDFSREVHKTTVDYPGARIKHILPTLIGLKEIVKRGRSDGKPYFVGREMTKRMRIWVENIRLTPANRFRLVNDESELLYQTVSTILRPAWRTSELPSWFAANTSYIYSSMKRPLPNTIAKVWLHQLPTAIAMTRTLKGLRRLLDVVSLLNLTDRERIAIARLWVDQENTIQKMDKHHPMSLGGPLRELYLLSPVNAYRFYLRYQEQFTALADTHMGLILRPLVHFQVVLGKDVPPIDRQKVRELFKGFEGSDSPFEKAIGEWLKRNRYVAQQGLYDPAFGALEMDWFLNLNGRKINLEIDGSQHDIIQPDGQRTPRLADLRRDEILGAQGIEVYRISTQDLAPENIVETERKLIAFLLRGK